MRTMLTREDIHKVLTTNIQDWKKHADTTAAKELNEALTLDDLCVVCSAAFYDDLNDLGMEMTDILDRHFLNTDLDIYARDAFILIHNIYNN